jgi:hypothetical protein
MREELKVKQITNSTGYNGKQYTLVVTDCGKLFEFTQTPEGKEEWRLIELPKAQ